MSADIIQAQYAELEDIARCFGKQAEVQLALQKTLRARVAALRGGAWAGRGADAFYAEMDGKLFPATQRLIEALNEAQKVTRQISALVAAAEADAARPFKGRRGAPNDLADPGVAPIHDPSRDRPILWGLFTDKFYYDPPYRRFTGSISPDGISPNDIDQGALGDCYLLAGLASIAQQHPEVIWNAIKDNGDGTYTVTLYEHGKPVQVTVDADFPVRQDSQGNPVDSPAYAGTGGGTGELWPMIMEKAYTQLQGDSYKDIVGGWPGAAIETITGRPAERLDLPVPADLAQATLQDLQDRLTKGEYVTAATRSKDLFENVEQWPTNVVPNHAYSIERVDAENGLIYLRNPWGSAYPVTPMALDEFNKYYNYVAANH